MENENTNEIILQIAECIDIPVYEIDISRSHRVGKYNPQTSTPRLIIVRFASNRSRELFYKNRKYLNESDYYYITRRRQITTILHDITIVREDLMREYLNLLRRCIEPSVLLTFFIKDGNTYYYQNDRQIFIRLESDIGKVMVQ
ncbi:unnamed protein product, partial [Didymodactylos carnosus]